MAFLPRRAPIFGARGAARCHEIQAILKDTHHNVEHFFRHV
jgi:hypothetical protein